MAAGYFQSYSIQPNLSDEYAQFTIADKNNIGVDFFIGNKEYLGKGFASLILEYFINNYCKNNTRIIADPESANAKAIRLYYKAGFHCIAEHKSRHKSYSILSRDI